jgi:DNA-binding NarL/FixJ family response regulator
VFLPELFESASFYDAHGEVGSHNENTQVKSPFVKMKLWPPGQKMPGVKLIFMTMNEDPYLIGEAFRAGASAFLLKQAAGFELIDAIEQALKGGKYVTPRAAKGLTNISLRDAKSREHAPEPSAREREVIQLLAEGRTMKEAAGTLKIATRTVAAHKYHAMELLQIKTNAELVQYAIKCKIISI